MGLDIYCHKTKHQLYQYDYQSVVNDSEKDGFIAFAEKYSDCLIKLAEVNGTPRYDEVHIECVKELSDMIRYPQFCLGCLGIEYDYNKGKYYYNVVPFDVWKEKRKSIFEGYYLNYDLYFRKVNFLFKFCENQDILIDERFAYVTKDIALDLIDRCKKVIAHHSLAKKLLPTQSGFFFGSTEYNDTYFEDVQDVLEQFEKFLPIFDQRVYTDAECNGNKDMESKKYNMYIIFSW